MSSPSPSAASGLVVERLSPALAGEFLTLFDRSFPDNPDWSGCYCRFYHCTRPGWSSSPAAAAQHRNDAAEAIAAGLQSGFLAYAAGAVPGEGNAVGWLSAGPRESFTNPRGYDEQSRGGDAWISCFVVDPQWRGRGVAAALLQSAVATLRADGLRSIEGFPHDPAALDASGDPEARLSAAADYKGPLALYRRLGFVREAELPNARVRVRLDL